MNTIPQVAESMQTILGPVSDQAALETGFCQRKGKLTGSSFMQTLVFSSLGKSDWRYSDLVTAAMNAGVIITKQGLEQRFTEKSAELARRVLEIAVQTVITTQKKAIPLLERFQGVYIRDSSVVGLPNALAVIWPGCSSSQGITAAVKLHTRLEISQWQLGGPILAPGREHDRASPFQTETLPPGALRMGDLGYFSIKSFAADARQGIWWLSRFKVGTCIFDQQGQSIDLLAWLRKQTANQTELPILLGKSERLPCRLLIERLPQAAVEKRRRKLREYARKKQTPLTDELLAFAEWTLILTNIPSSMLTIPEALILLHARWQIELLFKRWKSLFLIDEWRSNDVWRILTELYAKLLAAVVENWILLTCADLFPYHSLWKASLVVRQFATLLALFIHSCLELVLRFISSHLAAHCHPGTRHASPSLLQLLETSRVQP